MRSDFYYRVHVLSITLPPLRERHGDIPLLVEAYMERKGISCALPLQVRLAMEHYDWPGNVRELHNFLDRYTAFGDVALESLGDAGKTELRLPLRPPRFSLRSGSSGRLLSAAAGAGATPPRLSA